MPTSTYVALATTTLGASASSVTFSSIPADYRDLILVIEGTTGAGDYIRERFNGDSGSNYSFVIAQGTPTGSAASPSGTLTGAYLGDAPSSNRIYSQTAIMDYSSTDRHKPLLNRNDYKTLVGMASTRWANTAAISSIVIAINNGASFNAGTTFSLYGIEA